MKLRSTLLASAFLLLTGSLASASSTALASASISPAEGNVAPMTRADGTGCPTDKLAFLNPAPSEQSGICGPCSGVCAGASIGKICGFNAKCQWPYDEVCTEGKPACVCWTGPLP